MNLEVKILGEKQKRLMEDRVELKRRFREHFKKQILKRFRFQISDNDIDGIIEGCKSGVYPMVRSGGQNRVLYKVEMYGVVFEGVYDPGLDEMVTAYRYRSRQGYVSKNYKGRA